MPGSSASAATTGKNVPRRRGARRDCDRVSKAEDVPEYKGSLPVEELLAFVEGSVPSAAGVRVPVPDAKLRRTKRKEPSPVDGDIKFGVGDKLVELTEPHLACLPHAEPPNGSLNSSSSCSSQNLVSELPVNQNSCEDGRLSENGWLPSEVASHLMVSEDCSNGVIEKKEKEFVLVRKKRKPKIATAMNGDAESVKSLNGFCFCKNVRNSTDDYANANGFDVEEILETNGSTISRNSSDDSLARSFGSDIDDLSHFVGEEGHELYVDAPLCWNSAGSNNEGDMSEDDEKEESLSSFCSTMSSTESQQRLSSPSSSKVESLATDPSDILRQDRIGFRSDLSPDHSASASDERDRLEDSHASQRLETDSGCTSMSCADFDRRCTRPCCALPYRHTKHQTPVSFCDSGPSEDVSDIMFRFGCTVFDHLVDGGLCREAKCVDVLPTSTYEPDDGVTRPCSQLPSVDSSLSFVYSDSFSECRSFSADCLPNKCVRIFNGDTHIPADGVQQFEIHDVQSYMYKSECHLHYLLTLNNLI